MQRRDFLGFSVAAGLSMAGLVGCSKSGPLVFGIHPWIGYEPLYLAKDFGWLSLHARAWARGEVDASVCYEPTASTLQSEGGVRLFDSSDLHQTIFDVLVVTRETADRKPGAVRGLVAAHFTGLRHLIRSMHDAVYRVASRQGVKPLDVRKALATVMLPDLAANQRYLAASGRVEAMARSLSRLMLSEGMINSEPGFQRLCDPAFLPRRAP